ncbi:MAG TPA: helix-turn-helix domain-containing protein [Caulobacterales bacterium]|nr:helix-turn-helix domain-containing protein [Caulobacterales bacterium]
MRRRRSDDFKDGGGADGAAANASPQRRVGSVQDAIAILRHLEPLEGAAAGVNRIARALDISPSSCFNLLKTLVDEKFVDFDPATKLYSLGPGAIALGRRALDPAGAFALIRQRLEALADRHDVTAGLWRTRRGEQLTLVGFAESAAAFRIHLTVGQRMPNAAGAAGRCVMAFSQLDDAGIRRRFDAVKWADAPSFKAYLSEVRAARAKRWAMDHGAYISGVTTIASACLNAEHTPEYVITATLFAGAQGPARLEAIAADARIQAEWLEARLFKADRA